MKPHLSTIQNCCKLFCAPANQISTLGSRVANTVISAVRKQDWRDSGRMRIIVPCGRYKIELADALLFDRQHCKQHCGSERSCSIPARAPGPGEGHFAAG